jgi:hypothetical protein
LPVILCSFLQAHLDLSQSRDDNQSLGATVSTTAKPFSPKQV